MTQDSEEDLDAYAKVDGYRTMDELLEGLAHPNAAVRDLALFRLVKTARHDPQTISTLTMLLRTDSSPDVRASAAYLLIDVPPTNEVISAFIGGLSDPDGAVRANAIRALTQHQVDIPKEAGSQWHQERDWALVEDAAQLLDLDLRRTLGDTWSIAMRDAQLHIRNNGILVAKARIEETIDLGVLASDYPDDTLSDAELQGMLVDEALNTTYAAVTKAMSGVGRRWPACPAHPNETLFPLISTLRFPSPKSWHCPRHHKLFDVGELHNMLPSPPTGTGLTFESVLAKLIPQFDVGDHLLFSDELAVWVPLLGDSRWFEFAQRAAVVAAQSGRKLVIQLPITRTTELPTTIALDTCDEVWEWAEPGIWFLEADQSLYLIREKQSWFFDGIPQVSGTVGWLDATKENCDHPRHDDDRPSYLISLYYETTPKDIQLKEDADAPCRVLRLTPSGVNENISFALKTMAAETGESGPS